ncbi:SUMF1/EgtB/PvdO family nonheme iron enzyme [Sorangium sp. So ce1000]|uniref:SUMF1/EgtB/PvdO family nonheme iron enzyme n=1 Tax=Sorangium sp. So ce1000 TaxID=3133325 RepID=UPI003F63F845
MSCGGPSDTDGSGGGGGGDARHAEIPEQPAELSDPPPFATPTTEAEPSDPQPVETPATAAAMYDLPPVAAPTTEAELSDLPPVAAPTTETDEPATIEVPVVLPGSTEGCPGGMVRVEGEYCSAVVQECLEYHPEWTKRHGEPGVAARCLRFREPSRCVAKKTEHLSFCMDRYEYPNVPGELPRTLTSWEQAAGLCEAQGKRLCTEAEFNFACEGPELLPYVYGYERNAETCNQDRDYRFPDHSQRLLHYEACQHNARCAAEIARLDGREPAGGRAACASWAGVFDLNGNVNEWVVRTDQKAPYRSGLKGGWWGPIRSACRPMTTFHKEDDYGYEVGFRCCADVEQRAAE